MALQCYNKGCGLKYEADNNKEDSCLFHSGVPIFHDALKGWSCCKKRTTDFSEFLSIKGCTRGRHSNDKPEEPLRPEVSSNKHDIKGTNGPEIIYQGPKSAEMLQKERPSSEVAKIKLPLKVSASLSQALEKLKISKRVEEELKESETVMPGTRCKNAGCKTAYQGPPTDLEVCIHHHGAPVFHEGYKYWSCCCIQTMDFNAFLEQKGCSTGKHRWIPKQDKKKVVCRHDWHQTGNNVVVTIYAKNAHPEFSSLEANGTVLSCQIQFEDNKVFKREFHFWGVIDVKHSSVNMVPSKVEVTLRKADQVAWGKLEDPNYKPEPEPEDPEDTAESYQPDYDIDDDDISDSDEEWKYDTDKKKQKRTPEEEEEQRKREELAEQKRKQVEEEMRRAMEEKRKAKEQKERERQLEEDGEYQDMPDLE